MIWWLFVYTCAHTALVQKWAPIIYHVSLSDKEELKLTEMKFYLLLICSLLLVAPLKGSKMSPQKIWEYKDGLKWRYFRDDLWKYPGRSNAGHTRWFCDLNVWHKVGYVWSFPGFQPGPDKNGITMDSMKGVSADHLFSCGPDYPFKVPCDKDDLQCRFDRYQAWVNHILWDVLTGSYNPNVWMD